MPPVNRVTTRVTPRAPGEPGRPCAEGSRDSSKPLQTSRQPRSPSSSSGGPRASQQTLACLLPQTPRGPSPSAPPAAGRAALETALSAPTSCTRPRHHLLSLLRFLSKAFLEKSAEGWQGLHLQSKTLPQWEGRGPHGSPAEAPGPHVSNEGHRGARGFPEPRPRHPRPGAAPEVSRIPCICAGERAPADTARSRPSCHKHPPFRKKSFPGELLFIPQYPTQMPPCGSNFAKVPDTKGRLCSEVPQPLPHSLDPSPTALYVLGIKYLKRQSLKSTPRI